MFGIGPTTRIYIAVEAIDMRKGFEGLHGLVRDHLGQDPLSGHLFLFTNKTKTSAEGVGMGRQADCGCVRSVWRRAAFVGLKQKASVSLTMRTEELAMLVNGLDVKQTRQRNPWYRQKPIA